MEQLKEIISSSLKSMGLNLEELILFGSRARSNFMDESDWDILVVVRESILPEERKDVWYGVYRKLHEKFRDSSFDVIIKSKRDFEYEGKIPNTISNEAKLEGIRL